MSREFTADLLSDSGVRRIFVMRWSAMADAALASAAIGGLARAFLGFETHVNTLPLAGVMRPRSAVHGNLFLSIDELLQLNPSLQISNYLRLTEKF